MAMFRLAVFVALLSSIAADSGSNTSRLEKPKNETEVPPRNETKPLKPEGNATKPKPEGKPEVRGNETSKPETSKPETTKPEGKPETGKPETTKPEGKPETTKPEGKAETAKPEGKGNGTMAGNQTMPPKNGTKENKDDKGTKEEKKDDKSTMEDSKEKKDDKSSSDKKKELPPKAEKPSDDSQKEAESMLKGCSNSTCREEAKKKFAQKNSGKDAKVTNAFFKQAEADAAKEAAKDKAKGCVAKDLSKEQKAKCFDESKAGLDEAVDALLGNASAEVKAKKKKEMAKDAARDVLGDSFGTCMSAANAKRETCLGELTDIKGAAGLDGEDAKSIVDRHFQEKIRESASNCTEKACRKAGKAAAVAAGMLEREYAAIKSLGEIKSAAEIYSNCMLAGSDDTTCLGLARDEFVLVSGAREEDFTDEISSKVQKIGEALTTGTPVVMVRLKKMGASVVVNAASCDSSLQEWFTLAVYNRSKMNESKVESALAKACRVVDGEVEYRCSVAVNISDDEISLLSERTANSFAGQTLGARRLSEFLGRRLAAVTEVYASQDVSECAETDTGCLSGESSATTTPAPATSAPTPAPTSPTTAPTTAPGSATQAPEAPASGAAVRGLSAVVLAAFALWQ